jgi:hypothetical protein
MTEAVSLKAKQGKAPSRSAAPAKTTDHNSNSEDIVDSDLNPLHPSPPRKKRKLRLDRDPSTSPPAAPPAPPEVDFMREGYSADDIWRMVEDEFYSTAQSFTRHIHRAEYVRLKKLAKSRGAGTLRSIARATDGRTKQTQVLRLKVEADELRRKRKDAARLDGEGSSSSGEREDEDDYMRDSQLAGLMTGEMRSGKDLLPMGNAHSKTRAAAGFLQSPRHAEKKRKDVFDDDDLATVSRNRETSQARTAINGEEDAVDTQLVKYDGQLWAKPKNVFKQFARTTPSTDHDKPMSSSLKARIYSDKDLATSSPSRTKDNGTTNEDDTISSREAARDYLAKRRADKERREREEKKRKAKSGDSIPTFLF